MMYAHIFLAKTEFGLRREDRNMNSKWWSSIHMDSQGSPLIMGVITAFLLSLLFTLLMSAIYTWTNISESTLPYSAYTINALSTLFGAITAARFAGKKGWLYGGTTALIFSLLLAIIGSLIDLSASFQAQTLARILILILIGTFGGVIGVQFRRQY